MRQHTIRETSGARLAVVAGALLAGAALWSPLAAQRMNTRSHTLTAGPQAPVISQDSARTVARAQVPHSSVRSVQMQQFDGKKAWAVYLSVPGDLIVHEVIVDARTGKVLDDEHSGG